jgi:TonB family protein
MHIGPQGPVTTFDPLSLPKDSTAREPFLDPTALFADQVYMVRPLEAEGELFSSFQGKAARFVGGEQALVGYLKGRVLQHIAPGIGWLKPPVLHFHVDATGAPTRVVLVKTSGNAELDRALVRIFQEMPRWEAATDARGRAVPQAFLFEVGRGGC